MSDLELFLVGLVAASACVGSCSIDDWIGVAKAWGSTVEFRANWTTWHAAEVDVD